MPMNKPIGVFLHRSEVQSNLTYSAQLIQFSGPFLARGGVADKEHSVTVLPLDVFDQMFGRANEVFPYAASTLLTIRGLTIVWAAIFRMQRSMRTSL
jgi:hypothetical protein